MKFVKLHQSGREILVNLSTVAEVYRNNGSENSILYFNFIVDNGEQSQVNVDESLEEIYEKANGNAEAKSLTVENLLPDLEVDTKVLVWDNGYEFKVKGHFSHFENGELHTFDLGQTSWTGGCTTGWDNWELDEQIVAESKPLTVEKSIGDDVSISVNVRPTSKAHVGVNDSNDSEPTPNMGFRKCGPNCEAPPLPTGHIHKPHYKNPNFQCNPHWYCTGEQRY